jgi:hypothetical protein
MKTLHPITFMLLVSLSLVRLPASGALVEASDPRFGANSLTIDTSTQLAWLNLSKSVDLSYNQVLADTAPGGIFSGYRFATLDEVFGLYSSAGIPGLGYYPLSNAPIQSLISMVGPSGIVQGWPGIAGITGSFTLFGNQELQNTSGIYASGLNGTLYYLVAGSDFDFGRDTTSPFYGSWLVREVPEPDPCFIMTGGLVGFALIKRPKPAQTARRLRLP